MGEDDSNKPQKLQQIAALTKNCNKKEEPEQQQLLMNDISTPTSSSCHLRSYNSKQYLKYPKPAMGVVAHCLLLGGSWVVIRRVIHPVIWVITIVTLLLTPLRTTHEPPSRP